MSWSTSVPTEKISPLAEEISLLAELADAAIHQFIGIPDLRRRVKSQSKALQDGRTNEQYLAFMGVNKDDLARIDS